MASLRSWTNEKLAGAEPFSVALGSASAVASVVFAYLAYTRGSEVARAVAASAIRAARKAPGAQAALDGEIQKFAAGVEKDLHKHGDLAHFRALPERGLAHDEVLALLQAMKDREDGTWQNGQVSGGVYCARADHIQLMGRIYTMFLVSNSLHADVWPSVRKMEAEVIRMTATMLHGDEHVCGTMTSGGSESIILALKCYRDWAAAELPHISAPEVIVPVTAHAAFQKGCHLLRIKLVTVPVDRHTQQADVAAMRAAITTNTVALVASACQFPHGTIDPVPAIAALAREFRLGLHVDSCLGGYVLPFLEELGSPMPAFDFRLAGVTTMSCDTHKFGLGPKGTSVLLFSAQSLRKYMYFTCTDWPGGLYASPTLPGSRPGALVATTWASLVTIGHSGLLSIAKRIMTARDKLVDALHKIPDMHIVGLPHGPVVAWDNSKYNIYRLNELLSKKGYHLNPLQLPPAVHMCFTDASADSVDTLIADIIEADAAIRADNTAGNSGLAPIYGLASGVPDRTIVTDVLSAYLDVMLADAKQP